MDPWRSMSMMFVFSGIIVDRTPIPVPALVEDTSWKESREGTCRQVLGYPCGLTNLLSRQPVLMLVKQCHHDATALRHIGA
jgi:hypothetical protein